MTPESRRYYSEVWCGFKDGFMLGLAQGGWVVLWPFYAILGRHKLWLTHKPVIRHGR